jgi:hypothetical protein
MHHIDSSKCCIFGVNFILLPCRLYMFLLHCTLVHLGISIASLPAAVAALQEAVAALQAAVAALQALLIARTHRNL